MKRGFVLATLAAVLMAGSLRAGILAQETWDAPGNLQGWDFLNPTTTADLEALSTDGNPPSSLTLTEVALGTPEFDQVYLNDTGSPLLGNWATTSAGYPVSGISFDFYLNSSAQSEGFNSLNFYFQSDTTTWFYFVDVSSQPGNSWATYFVPVNVNDPSPAGWGQSGGSLAFNAAVMDVTEIGFDVGYVTDASQVYGFDNLMLTYSVPEPETYAAIGFALVAVAMAFRRRLSELLATVRIPTAA